MKDRNARRAKTHQSSSRVSSLARAMQDLTDPDTVRDVFLHRFARVSSRVSSRASTDVARLAMDA